METFKIKNLTFKYPGKESPVLRGINLDIDIGEFVVVCGQSGSGKSTLLRNLKPVLAPHGTKTGEILFYGQNIEGLDQKIQAARIGYVLQDPDAQIVTDKVWHELAFGLESLGMDTKTIRLRVAEMASFFGIQNWFNKDVNHLSGGQKQLLNLASVMAMQPDVLILDEPTSQLDPIAAGDFLETVKKINRELGTTVIITEHRLEEVIPMADRVVVMDGGSVIADDIPANTGAILAQKNHPMFMAMPTPLQVYSVLYQDMIGRNLECPVDVREGRTWLTELLKNRELTETVLPADEEAVHSGTPVIEMKDVWFRYEKNGPDIVKDLNAKIYRGEMFCIVGGNGTGKSTALTLAGGMNRPYRGKVKRQGSWAMLPQNPQSLFVEATVRADLMESFEGSGLSGDEMMQKLHDVVELVGISHLLDMHPYDLSGGEQQRTALAKVLLLEPEILLLDEPTKGIDNQFKNRLADTLKKLCAEGMTVVMVSHDVEFCGRYGDRCAMFFDGKIITTNAPRTFFSGNSFYTTAANRMSRHIFENAVNVDDVVELVRRNFGIEKPDGSGADPVKPSECEDGYDDKGDPGCGDPDEAVCPDGAVTAKPVPVKTGKQRIIELSMLLMAAATVYVGMFVMEKQQYMAVGMLLIVYIMIPFFTGFEGRKPKAREVVILAVLIAIATVGRAAFFMFPNFKPLLAIAIITGVSLGKESGFIVGAMSAFVSNFMFGQGPWTPWQMIATALIGYVAGLIFHRYADRVNKWILVVFGGFTAFFVYGAIADIWSILAVSSQPSLEIMIMLYSSATLFNAIHAAATVIFLFLLAKPMIAKLNRLKMKYGM